MPKRLIVHIDEEKCDGCGLCVPSCQEGAIQVVNGKARLVADAYCDGLGACLGHCPRGAISIIEREADPFDEKAAMAHARGAERSSHGPAPVAACPGSAHQDMRLAVLGAAGPPPASGGTDGRDQPQAASRLANWPVQLQLVSPYAAFLRHADLLLVADCVPFALADFHSRFLDGRPVVVGCPKLDDASAYVNKLTQILTVAEPRSVTVLHMEVPCCTGLMRIAQAACQAAGASVRLDEVVISIRGQLLSGPAPPAAAARSAHQ